MAGSHTTRRGLSSMLRAGLYAYYIDAYEAVPTIFDKLFKVVPSTEQKEEIGGLSGLGDWVETPESTPIHTETPVERDLATFTHKKYTKAISISSEAVDDGRYGNIVQAEGTSMGKGAKRKMEKVAADIFNLNTTLGAIYDGQNFFANAHPIKDGSGTYDNLYDLTFSYANLQTVMTAIVHTNAVDEKGEKIIIKPDVLVVAPALKFLALNVLKTVGEPDTANNSINVFNLGGELLELVVWPYLTSATSWFVGEKQEGLIFFERKKPTFEDNNEFTTGDFRYKGEMRFSCGVIDWRHWIQGKA